MVIPAAIGRVHPAGVMRVARVAVIAIAAPVAVATANAGRPLRRRVKHALSRKNGPIQLIDARRSIVIVDVPKKQFLSIR